MSLTISVNNCCIYLLIFALSMNSSWSKQRGKCGEPHMIQPKGTISSPYYPELYPAPINCTWYILAPPQTTLKINGIIVDIPYDPECIQPPCCHQNFVSLPVSGKPNVYEQLCGNISHSVITVSQNLTTIIFQYRAPSRHGRGFRLSYSIEKKACDDEFRCKDGTCLEMSKRCDGVPQCSDASDEMDCPEKKVCDDKFHCKDGTCLEISKRCDGVPQCSDASDEMDCPGSSKCAEDELPCGGSSDHCYKLKDWCNGVFQCPYGEDEIGCSNYCEFGIKCQNVEQCFLPSQRCDGHADCNDGSDEAMCPDELCPMMANKHQCHNGRCIEAKLWCNGNDDCGDFSDEEACLDNSMITIAMMGALLGGLFLVLAVGCSLRFYSRRCSSSGHNYQLRLSPPGASHLRIPHSLSLPALIDNEFFNREPPPMYSVAVGTAGLPRRSRGNRSRALSRRTNHRHTVAVAVPKPPSESTLNESSSSPSEDSLMSSSNVQVTNTDDSEQLISA